MASEMTKRQRVLAALRGDPVDRVPVSAWGHDYLREWSPLGLSWATLDAYRRYDWDFIKVNPRATYYAEGWGARYLPSGKANQPPKLTGALITSAADLDRLRVLNVTRGAYGDQLEALSAIIKEVGEVPVIQTVFSPLAVMSRLCRSPKDVPPLMVEATSQLKSALTIIAETLAAYARACIDRGAAGIFFATVEWGSRDNISPQTYELFARPYDLRVLEAAQGAPFNVLHVCRDNNLLNDLLDYPVAAFHWAAHSDSNPSLADILSRTDKAVMGGVSHESTILSGTPEAVSAEAAAAIEQTGERRFLLAPGCSVDPQTPEANLRALREAAQRSGPT